MKSTEMSCRRHCCRRHCSMEHLRLLGGRAVFQGHAVLLGSPVASSAVAVRRRRGCLTHSWQQPLGDHSLTFQYGSKYLAAMLQRPRSLSHTLPQLPAKPFVTFNSPQRRCAPVPLWQSVNNRCLMHHSPTGKLCNCCAGAQQEMACCQQWAEDVREVSGS